VKQLTKHRILILVGTLLADHVSWAAEPTFDYHVVCSSAVPERRIDLFLSEYGHPQFGFRFEGVGIREVPAYQARQQFQVFWDAVSSKPLRGIVHSPDGFGSWLFEMSPKSWFGRQPQVPVTEYPEECSMPPCALPLTYIATCEVKTP